VTVTNTANIATLNLTNALGVPSGGTGRANLTLGSVVVGNNTGTVTLVAPGTANNVLTSNGTHWVSQTPAASGITTGKAIAMAMIFGF
jgi:DNA/RNA endonuclease YhcR with UshA esterase domain